MVNRTSTSSELTEEEKKRKKLFEETQRSAFQQLTTGQPQPQPGLTAQEKEAIIQNSKQETKVESGGIFKGGQFFPLSRQDIASQQNVSGLQPTTTATEQQTGRSEKALQLFNQFQGQPLPPEILATLSPADIDEYQAIASGLATGIPSAVGGAIAGTITGGTASIPLAVLSGATGFITALRSNIGAQISGDIEASVTGLEKGEANLRTIVTDVNTGGNAVKDTQLFYETVNALRKNQAELKLTTQSDLAKFSGKDGASQLARYNVFFNQTLPLLERSLQQAIINPDPNKILITPEDLQ